MAAIPTVSIIADGAVEASGSSLTSLIGSQRVLTLRFDNQPDATSGSSVGYAPYIDMILPRNGADGAGVATAR